MDVPVGLSEDRVLEVIEIVVNYLAPSFIFGYYDVDDMKQEGRIYCLEALSSFDFDKSNRATTPQALLTYLKVCVRRKFINLRRNKFQRLEPPSCSCKLCVSDDENRLDCHKYAAWLRRNLSKRSLMESFNVDEVHTEESGTVSKCVGEAIMSNDIIKVLDKYMPARNRSDYRRFIENVRIPKERRERVIVQIRAVLAEHYSGEAEEWDFE